MKKPLLYAGLCAGCVLMFAAPALATKPLPVSPENGSAGAISSGDAETTAFDDEGSAGTSAGDDGDADDLGAPAAGSGGTISSDEADTTTLGDDGGDGTADSVEDGTVDDLVDVTAAASDNDVRQAGISALHGCGVSCPWKHLATR